ncbi:AlpA family phage regulatory protein [Xenorhabdus sp. XENO-7]|uniref:AlpA family phage regulatory protein n=1 Tax=Xenorhabdus aichiensis TaxID=3025874 RepID=A0ABT5M8U4_9GAMM|nr:AlpA family phage regulatory protein [Xenorhabdus aichiensis]MDC9622691.1 AlpA family phage regulatory protein [Xenorhabdus aichiensis]
MNLTTYLKIYYLRPKIPKGYYKYYREAWIYKFIGNGILLKQVKIGSPSVAFIKSEIDGWIAQCII